MKRVIHRPRADNDIDAILLHYTRVNVEIANDFLYEVLKASDQISRMPGIGSPRLSYQLEIPGLRSYSLDIFPYTLIYFERENHIDLARILHSHRDIFNLLLGIE